MTREVASLKLAGWLQKTRDFRKPLREEKKLSRQKLAEKAGLHQTSVGLIERMLRSPNLDSANAIADALEVDLSGLIVEAQREHRKSLATLPLDQASQTGQQIKPSERRRGGKKPTATRAKSRQQASL